MSERKNIAKRAGMVGFFTLISRIAGLIRDMSVAYAFGTHVAADAFFVAFRIPNLLRRLFAEGALTVSFVPVFTQYLKKSYEEAKKVVNVTFTVQTVALIAISAAGILLSPWLVKLTAWGFSSDPEKFALTVKLTRVMFPYLLMISLAAWAMGILNSCKHFGSPAASPIFMNLGIILGALVFTRYFDPPVMGLAIGVLVGGAMQLACHFPFLAQFKFWPSLTWEPRHPAVKRILGMMVPAAYGAAVYQFNVIAGTFLASFLPTGSVSYLWYADRVMEFPLGIFAVSLATVILPTLSEHAADNNVKALKETFGFALRMIFFITVPAAGGLMILSNDIIRTLFQHGEFGPASTQATASALICFAAGLPFISGVRVTSNAFYSMQDSKTPVRVATMSVAVDFAVSLALMWSLKHVGLAIAVATASVFNFVMHVVDFRKKVGALGLGRILAGTARTVIATLVMVGAIWAFKRYVPLLPGREGHVMDAARLGVHIVLGIAVYLLAGLALRMEEFSGLKAILKKRGRAKTPPPIEPASDPSGPGDIET
ncbi:MAG TPA: murein biosynthesis integral membrane protein MurJ [bacterium]|nr:murein biosynthesis integral membrane protein MurJ [bacterium]